ncbi:MAG: SWIB/MDM2 domain-containing protein [Bacteriovoracaceae bacterium]|nr:SWIB/MDM2 domain-containing protein [Bacteriovoracaceae bacterium]
MAKKATKKAPAKKVATKKAPAKKATAKKAPVAKKAPAKKATAKKTPVAKKAPAAKKATAKKAPVAKKAKSARKPNAAFMKALTPSAELSAVIGTAPAARTEVVKKLWAYIKKNNLQNPKNKRNILADEKLAKVFGKKEVTMFELASLIGKHLK